MMRTALALLFAWVWSVSIHARDLRPELIVEGRVKEIAISPAGDLWIGTAMGYAYRSEDGGRTWSEVNVSSRKMTPETFLGDHLDRIAFFDDRRAMFFGYIGEDTDQILLTEDGGATWSAVHLPNDGLWVYDAQVTPDGHAWLAGSDTSVLRSDDYGRTWRELQRPFAEDVRTMSVWFESPLGGAVASLNGGLIAITDDGGATWRPFEADGRAEIVRGCGESHEQRIEKVRMTGGRIVVAQCGGVFASAIAPPRKWTRVTAGGTPLADFELASGGALSGVTDGRDIYEAKPDGSSRSLGLRFPHILDIAVSGERIALLDATNKVAVFDGRSWFTSRMFGKGVATKWPITDLDRGADDVLWGISSFFLYRSTDGAKTWDRVTELPAAAERVFIQGDGNVLLFDSHGWVARWDVTAARLGDVAVLNGLDIVGSFRRDDLWLLFGGRQYQTAGRVEVAQTFFAGQFAGSVDYGFVAASVDGGRTWNVIDRWKDEGPQTAFLSDDNQLTLVSWLGGIRQGKITREPLGATMRTLLRGEDRKRVPYVQRAYVLDLLDPSNGWLIGWIHHIGTRAYRTSDGGRSWKGAEGYTRVALHRLFDGTWIGVVPPSTLQRWNGKTFDAMTIAPGEITQVWVDSRGSLALRSKDGGIHVLDPKQRALRSLTPSHK